jgi:hypothetical protein
MITIDDEELEKRIIAALEDKPLCSKDLLHRLDIEPGGGEAVGALWSLMRQGIISRRETWLYELKRETKEEDV